MSQPDPYVPSTDFTDLPDEQVKTKLDIEFTAVSATLSETLANIALIQRDDGALLNQIVTPDSLSQAVLNLIGGYTFRGVWATATAYHIKDAVTNNGGTYVATVAHTSGGSFTTDFNAGKWILIAATGLSTVGSLTLTGSVAPVNGIYLPATNTIGISANSCDVLRLSSPSASSVDYFTMVGSVSNVYGSITRGQIQLQANGATDQVDIHYIAKGRTSFGIGSHLFFSDVDMVLRICSEGTDSNNRDLHLNVEGGSSSNTKIPSLRAMKSSSAYPYTPNGGNYNVTTDDVSLGLLACGRGSIYFYTRGGNTDTDPAGGAGTGGGVDVPQFRVTDTPAAANYFSVTGRAVGAGPVLGVVGADTNIGCFLQTKGTGAISLFNGSLLTLQIDPTASSVNYLRITGGATGNPAVIFSGGETNVGISMLPKGTGVFAAPHLNVTGSAIVSNGLYLPAANNPGISAGGFDVLRLSGSGTVVNYFTMLSRATGVQPILGVTGSDADVGLLVLTKGAGTYSFQTGAGEQFGIAHTASVANRIRATGSAAGSGPQLFINGTDTDIDFNINPKGVGLLQPGGGSFVANGSVAVTVTSLGPSGAATTIQKWLKIKDAGTVRYIPCY